MNFNIGSLFIKAHTLLPIQVCFPFSDGLTTFSRSSPRAPSPFHSTQCSCYPAILCICLVLSPKSSLSFKLGQGRACLIGTARNLRFVFFSEGEDIHLHYIYLQGHCTKTGQISLNSNSRFFFFPDYQLLPRAFDSSLLHIYHP